MRSPNINNDQLQSILFWLSSCHGCLADADERRLRLVRVENVNRRRPDGIFALCDKCLVKHMRYFSEIHVLAVSRPTPEQRRRRDAVKETCLIDAYERNFMAAYEAGHYADEQTMVTSVVAEQRQGYYQKLAAYVHDRAAAAGLERAKARLARLKTVPVSGQVAIPSADSAASTLLLFVDSDDYCTKKIGIIKAVRLLTGADVKTAKDAVENEALRRWPPTPVRFTGEGGIVNGTAD
jgi:hypothetical protein